MTTFRGQGSHVYNSPKKAGVSRRTLVDLEANDREIESEASKIKVEE